MNDEELVTGIKQNSHNSFKELYYKYYHKLLKYAYFRLHSIEDSRDLVQELFTKVWIGRQNLDPKKSVQAYLYKSLLNAVINHSKLHSSKVLSIDSPDLKNIEANKADLLRSIDLKNAIGNLPEKLKTVYTLSRVEGFKYIEIAQICDISVKAVEKRMSKALEILRIKLF